MKEKVLTIDYISCNGHGICALFFPERVDLDRWGYAKVDETPSSERSLVRRANRAVRSCPSGALQLIDVEREPLETDKTS